MRSGQAELQGIFVLSALLAAVNVFFVRPALVRPAPRKLVVFRRKPSGAANVAFELCNSCCAHDRTSCVGSGRSPLSVISSAPATGPGAWFAR